MTKYILVGGYIHKAPDNGKAFCEEIVKGFIHKPVKILDCMFARNRDIWEDKMKEDEAFFSRHITDFKFELADPDRFTEQVENSDVIFLRGGYTSPLLDLLSRDLSWTQKLDGKVVVGTSAGGDAIAKYYYVLKTLRAGDGLNLLPIKFIPHWKSDYSDEDARDIDWDKALNELKNYKEELEIVTLGEGEFRVFNK